MASFVSNNWKGHLYVSVSELHFTNALGLLRNNRSNFRENHSDFLRGAYYRSKIRGESLSHEKQGISSKFVCITFAQYCSFPYH